MLVSAALGLALPLQPAIGLHMLQDPARASAPVKAAQQLESSPVPPSSAARKESGKKAGDEDKKARSEKPGNPAPADNSANKIVQEGISVEFSMEPAEPGKSASKSFLENQNIGVQFSIKDTATGSPLRGVHPAAWLDVKAKPGHTDTVACKAKVASFLSASAVNARPIDLNSYYVLALNGDSTISVVDPRFGYGGSRLLYMISLSAPGEDWVLNASQSRLFVTLPELNQVAFADTSSWKVISSLDVGGRPGRLALQPDEHYLWVAYGVADQSRQPSGVVVIDAAEMKVVARIPTGRGAHELAFSSDSGVVFVTNSEDGTVSLLDANKLQKIKDVQTGRRPSSIAFSDIAKAAYVIDEADGTVIALKDKSGEILGRAQAEPGIEQIKLTPGGRFGVVLNPTKGKVDIVDCSNNRIVQNAPVDGEPDQVSFSGDMAFIRRRKSETVLMISLSQLGKERTALSFGDFPGGERYFGQGSRPTPAAGIVRVPGENAVLVANPGDKSIYYYEEGMAAPMGTFSNYGREPRAVLVVDRSLREQSPGVYRTFGKLRGPGIYDVAFVLDTPRIVHCFEVKVDADPEFEAKRISNRVSIQFLLKDRSLKVGEPVSLQFKLVDPVKNQPIADLKDVIVLSFLAPGIWQKRYVAAHAGDGIYNVSFTPPQRGVYYLYLASESIGLKLNNPQYQIIEVK